MAAVGLGLEVGGAAVRAAEEAMAGGASQPALCLGATPSIAVVGGREVTWVPSWRPPGASSRLGLP